MQGFDNHMYLKPNLGWYLRRKLTICYLLRSYVNSPASGAFGAGLVSPPSVSSGSGSAAGHKQALPPTPDSLRPNDRIKACDLCCCDLH